MHNIERVCLQKWEGWIFTDRALVFEGVTPLTPCFSNGVTGYGTFGTGDLLLYQGVIAPTHSLPAELDIVFWVTS